jgi:undecaprenyl pyrophosphate synthase
VRQSPGRGIAYRLYATRLRGLASELTVSDIARHLYTAGQPDPDLVIRTNGERCGGA